MTRSAPKGTCVCSTKYWTELQTMNFVGMKGRMMRFGMKRLVVCLLEIYLHSSIYV